MDVLRATSVPGFLDMAGEFLEAHEAEHNLIFGICSNIEQDPSRFPAPPYFATVLHGDKVVGAAIRTPPWRLVLSTVDHPGAVHRIAEDLVGEAIPGVVGPDETARHFAEAWREATGIEGRRARGTRAFRLQQVVPPQPAPGGMRRARDEDRAVLAAWAEAFHAEAVPDSPDQDFERMAGNWINGIGRTAYLWVDDDDIVSLTCAGGLTPHGIRIGPVYTPPDARGRGYASNLVAEVSQGELDAGRSFVFLFTDQGNPTANKIYRDIGYEPVIDFSEYDFSSAAG